MEAEEKQSGRGIDVIGFVSIFFIVIFFSYLFFPIGVFAGSIIAIVWYIFPVVYTLSITHIFFVALTPNINLQTTTLLEIILLSMTISSISGFGKINIETKNGINIKRKKEQTHLNKYRFLDVFSFSILGFIFLLGVLYIGYIWSNSIIATALLVCIISCIIGYGIHRYELITLKLIDTNKK